MQLVVVCAPKSESGKVEDDSWTKEQKQESLTQIL